MEREGHSRRAMHVRGAGTILQSYWFPKEKARIQAFRLFIGCMAEPPILSFHDDVQFNDTLHLTIVRAEKDTGEEGPRLGHVLEALRQKT